MKNSDEPYTPEILYTWRDVVLTYEQLDDILKLAVEDPSILVDKSTLNMLRETVEKKNILRDLFKVEGKQLIAEWLTPYYGRFKVEAEDEAAKEYRKLFRQKKKEGKKHAEIIKEIGTEEEYIQDVYLDNKASIDERTYNFLLEELTVASRDVSDVTRWLDNMLDTSDAVSAAMVNAWVEMDNKARLEAIKKETEFIEEVRASNKAYPKGKVEGEDHYYSWMLEHDADGNPTQFILKPWNSEVFELEKKLKKDFFMKHSKSEIKKLNKQLAELRVEDTVAFAKALNEYVRQVYTAGLISKEDYNTIVEARKDEIYIDQLSREGEISDEASDLLMGWIYNNRPYYYKYAEKYQSKEWNKFMRELGISIDQPIYAQQAELQKSEHPKARFYNYINSVAAEADRSIPYSFRLGYRLPGVAKDNLERMKEGQQPMDYLRETLKSDLFVRPEDTERGNQEFTDEQGNVKMFLPIHYTAKLEPQNQSYDIPGIYFRYWHSTNSYALKRNILSEMEMARYFVETRRAKKLNPAGKVIERLGLRKSQVPGDEPEKREAVEIDKTNVAAMLGDWFEMAVYGKKSKASSRMAIGQNMELDGAKLVDALNRYTSLNLLGFNIVQGTANVMIGETMEAIDAIAGEWVTVKDLSKATLKYSQWLPGMMGDVGLMGPENVGSLLIREFDVMHRSPTEVELSRVSRAGQLASMDTLFFVQKAGEHWMQGRFLFAMLNKKRAKNSKGEDIGSMLDYYYAKDGKLMIKDEVDLVKSKWTEKDQLSFMRKVKGVLSRMHGEYSDLGRVALQRMALGRMAYMFRKFVIPGFKRRYQKRQYIERLGQYVEGNYVTTMRFAGNLVKDLKGFKLALMTEQWHELSPHEKANIHRTIAEVAFLTLTIIMAGAAYKLMDDDDEHERFWAFMAYEAYRLKTEMLFFSPKLDEAMSILRSPMASMSVIENIIKLTGQMFDPMEVYERGPWKGDLKIKRTAINFIPLYKQYYKVRDVEEQIAWFRD